MTSLCPFSLVTSLYHSDVSEAHSGGTVVLGTFGIHSGTGYVQISSVARIVQGNTAFCIAAYSANKYTSIILPFNAPNLHTASTFRQTDLIEGLMVLVS